MSEHHLDEFDFDWTKERYNKYAAIWEFLETNVGLENVKMSLPLIAIMIDLFVMSMVRFLWRMLQGMMEKFMTRSETLEKKIDRAVESREAQKVALGAFNDEEAATNPLLSYPFTTTTMATRAVRHIDITVFPSTTITRITITVFPNGPSNVTVNFNKPEHVATPAEETLEARTAIARVPYQEFREDFLRTPPSPFSISADISKSSPVPTTESIHFKPAKAPTPTGSPTPTQATFTKDEDSTLSQHENRRPWEELENHVKREHEIELGAYKSEHV